ncbi:hypothetical protein [Denitromonas iodatirespirans]|uniref:Uncharacterized protein n=1 Tax=Denitromonas iodatirespirans TaxID=2795389 RepID=A0A944DGF9_DENI1|nr:hypothetical protein [Denitromonas iodatirespirans]MBT0962388.1 hypothetical protein [Denitromonas iodatirespirans]
MRRVATLFICASIVPAVMYWVVWFFFEQEERRSIIAVVDPFFRGLVIVSVAVLYLIEMGAKSGRVKKVVRSDEITAALLGIIASFYFFFFIVEWGR